MIGKVDIVNDRTEEVKRELSQKIANALEDIGKVAESNAKLVVPVNEGILKNSISHEVDSLTVYIGTNVEYARYVEFGTSRMVARPYLGPAIKGELDTYRKMVMDELKR